MRRAAGYVSASAEGQAEHGLGLDLQRRAIADHCEARGLDLTAVYEDAGLSGARGVADRLGWARLVDGLEAGESSVVVVLRLDRLARDVLLQEIMLANVQGLGGELVSIDEPDLCSSDPGRALFRQTRGAIAEYEKAMVVLRLRAGRRRKMREGGYAGGWLPYGYATEGAGSEARPAVDPEEAAVVSRVFQEYAGGRSMKQIAEALTAEGVPTKRGGRWAQNTVRVMLANPFYAGQVRQGDTVTRNGHEAVIDGRLFADCQRRMAEARRRPAAAPSEAR